MAVEATAVDGFVVANGLRLHYLEWGAASAPPILMLHGLRGYARTWEGVAQTLCRHYRVVALDQRGRGESDWAPSAAYSRDEYVSDLESFVGQVAGLERFVLLGHSMGGANAIVFAAKHPERVTSLLIEDMGPATDPPMPGTARISREVDATPASFASWTEAAAFMRQLRPTASEEGLRGAVDASMKQLPDGRITWKYDLEGIRAARRQPGNPTADLWPHVRALQCSTLVLRGGVSDILAAETAQAMCAANANIRWVEIPGASHFAHDDNPADFNTEVGRFLASR